MYQHKGKTFNDNLSYTKIYFYHRKKFSSELNILSDSNGIASVHKTTSLKQNPATDPESQKLKLSTHRSDHEIHTPEHRSFCISEKVSIKNSFFYSRYSFRYYVNHKILLDKLILLL